MASPEHVAKLMQGVKAWNKWRDEHPEVDPDLIGAKLFSANLAGANLAEADMSHANLGDAILGDADLFGASLAGANLYSAILSRADLSQANLDATDMTRTVIGGTSFGSNDLSSVVGLETVTHVGPSTISIDTIYLSKGRIPEAFLRGVGVPEDFIVYVRSLTTRPIEFYSSFISHSSKDQEFATELHTSLRDRGVRCWFAPEDLKIGDPFQDLIEESIRIYDKLLVVLSENSVASSWVEREVNAAFEKEEKQKRKGALFPIRLDDSVMDSDRPWAAEIRRTRHIGDFRRWKDHDSFQKSLDRLLRDLKS